MRLAEACSRSCTPAAQRQRGLQVAAARSQGGSYTACHVQGRRAIIVWLVDSGVGGEQQLHAAVVAIIVQAVSRGVSE